MSDPKQHAFITGGTGSLGREIAKVLRPSFCSVHAPGSGELDVRDRAAVRDYFHSKHVDLLVCAAGFSRDVRLPRLSEATWDETWAVNCRGAIECARAVLPGMVHRASGHIVFISSQSAIHPPAGQVAYASAKAALLDAVRDFSRVYGGSNVRVNAVLPGFMETRMTETVTALRRDEILASHALGRFNTPVQVANFIRFLHDELPHTSGQVFQLDSR
jgi:3-oxoacyl-[acyl-carrier protein] reductase